MKPKPVTNRDLIFGGNAMHLLPAYSQIPSEFKDGKTNWNKIVSRWFFSGLPKETKFIAKEGVSHEMAINHLNAIMRSWEPKHEHKEAGVAYLMSLWFKDIIIP